MYCSVLVLFPDWSLGGSECEKTKRIYSHLRKWTCMLQNQCCFMSVCVCVLFCQNTCCDRVINPKLWLETARLDAAKHTCTGAGRRLFLVFLTQAEWCHRWWCELNMLCKQLCFSLRVSGRTIRHSDNKNDPMQHLDSHSEKCSGLIWTEATLYYFFK